MKFIHKNDERGLGLIELLLLLLLLLLLIFLGWFVYDKNKETKDQLDKTGQSSEAPKNEKKYYEFKEYGVKIVQSNELAKLSHEAKTTDIYEVGQTTSLFLNDSELAKAIDGCNTTKGSSGNFAAILKVNGNFPADPTPDIGGLLKQFDTFYISNSYPNGIPCEDAAKEEAVVKQMQALQKALVEAFKTAEKI